ncbi:hypothetical protein BAFK78_J018 (plasmid) [Borreliella afzelii K78]|nr:hypothetical protein BAFK78_J018 [Borreliella afzelii K78]
MGNKLKPIRKTVHKIKFRVNKYFRLRLYIAKKPYMGSSVYNEQIGWETNPPNLIE